MKYMNMNKLMFLLLLISVSVFGQKSITVVMDTCQNIKWPLNLSLRQAEDSNLVKYPNYTVGRNTFLFDIEKRMLYSKHDSGVIKIKITKYVKNGTDYIFEYNNLDLVPGKILLSKKIDDTYTMIVQYSVKKEDKEFSGFFIRNINEMVFK